MGNQPTTGNVSACFSDYYVTGDRIGSGTFAVVKRCYRKSDPKQAFAVKIIDKKNLTPRELVGLKYEIKILQAMEHPMIIKAVDVFEDRRKVKIVLELCEGGDLFDLMLKVKDKRLDEKKAAQITCKIARALKYLHEHYVVHRDLKPENILFTTDDQIKITDFGLAHYLKLQPELHLMHTCCGTPHYVAPEILSSEEYGVEVDFWSLGVILYIMLSGYQPFNSTSVRAMYDMIIRGQYCFPTPYWDDISAEAVSCVKALMHLNPKERLTCDTLCTHPFISKHVSLDDIEKEETQLLQQQHTLMQSSYSQLLPQGACRVSLDAAINVSRSERCHDDDSQLNECRKQEKRERVITPTKHSRIKMPLPRSAQSKERLPTKSNHVLISGESRATLDSSSSQNIGPQSFV